MAGRIRLVGYRRLPGAARRYVAPSGQQLSYRQYRATLEREGAVRRLEAADLANRRRQQRQFNDIVNQMAKVSRAALDSAIEETERQIEIAEEIGFDEQAEALQDDLADLLSQRRTVKSRAIKSQSRKEALADLKRFHHPKSPADELRLRQALKTLGRREGVPDFFPVGSYDPVTKRLRFREAA